MKIKVADLYDLGLGLADLADKELAIKVSYKIHRNQQIVTEELQSSEKVRQKIINKYKEKDVDEGFLIKKDKIDEFNEELNELMKQEVEVKLQKIKVDELKDIAIKPKTLNMLKTILNAE